uniref:Putative enzymatic polyprotein n=1 Tax=Lygus hesperus TaxID=30085 RepID=A0A0A9YMB8_LYGHE
MSLVHLKTKERVAITRATRGPPLSQRELPAKGDPITTAGFDRGNGGTRGGQLSQFVHRWRQLGAPPQLCSLIEGYAIPFAMVPPFRGLRPPFPRLSSTPQSPQMDAVIQSLLDSDMISPSTESSGFISPMFLVYKGDGSPRPVFNLKRLNTFLQPKKFRLINHFRVPSFLQREDFLASIDLSQAYCHVPITPRHRRFLSFVYKDTVYQWTCLPFGLATAPQAFAQLTNWVASYLRNKGIRTIVYLDDFLFAHQDPSLLEEHLRYVTQLLLFLGWQINFKKSQMVPTQLINFLGITWNTKSLQMSLPEAKVLSISNLLLSTIHRSQWSLKSAQILIGVLNFAAFAVPLGRLHLRWIQIATRPLRRVRPRQLLPLSERVLGELRWWQENLRHSSSFHPPVNRVFLSTDASDRAWGAEISGTHIQGLWSRVQQSWHINRKELYAVRAAILSSSSRLRNCTVVLQTDNKTVAAYIRKQGGLRSATLLRETEKLFQLTSALNLHILPFFIPGRLNSLADRLSRGSAPPDWHLGSSITRIVFSRWGVPEIDLFATYRSRVVDAYVTRDSHDHHAAFTDAFSRLWNFTLAWVFPPPPLLPQVLHHLNSAQGLFLVVAPRWSKVFWRADLKARAIAPPLVFRDLKQHLTDLTTDQPPPQIDEMILEIWLIRGGVSRSRIGRRPIDDF